jgi:hypothetical protein
MNGIVEKVKDYIVDFLSTDGHVPKISIVEDDENVYHFVEFQKVDGVGGMYNVYAVLNLNTYEVVVSHDKLEVGIKSIVRIGKIFDVLTDDEPESN